GGVYGGADGRRLSAFDHDLESALGRRTDVAGRAAMEPGSSLEGSGERVLFPDHLVGAVRTAGAEEGALTALVERDEPQAGPRLADEAKAGFDAFVSQLAVEQMAEFVVADDAGEAGAQPQPREAH